MRRALSLLTLGAVMGAVLLTAWPSAAGNGDVVVLGQKNTARRITAIKIKNGLIIEATKFGRPAATFVANGSAPFSVSGNSSKVADLNADLLDYYEASELQVMTDYHYSDDIDDDSNWSSEVKTIWAPGRGVLLMSGTVDFTNNKATSDWVACQFIVDGVPLGWTHMTTWAEPGESGICHSTGVFPFLPAGTYTVQFETVGMSPSEIEGGDGSWWVIYVPDPVF